MMLCYPLDGAEREGELTRLGAAEVALLGDSRGHHLLLVLEVKVRTKAAAGPRGEEVRVRVPIKVVGQRPLLVFKTEGGARVLSDKVSSLALLSFATTV
jgi:hypothetical protein